MYTWLVQMPFEPKVKLLKVVNGFTVTIPADMVEDLAWDEGDILRIDLENDRLIIHKESKGKRNPIRTPFSFI